VSPRGARRAVVLLLLSAIAVWARRTVFDSAKVADLVTDAVNEPEVSAALADYLTQQVLASVDVDAVVADVLPSQVERLEPAIASGIEGAIDRGINALLQQPAVQDQLEQLVQRAHGAAMRLLEGDGLGDGISVSDGVVTLNLVPLVRGLGRVQELGLLGDVDLPEATAAGDPDQQIADLEQALGRDLPDDFAQLVVYRSDSLAAAQASLESAEDTFALVKRALWLLLALTVVFVAATSSSPLTAGGPRCCSVLAPRRPEPINPQKAESRLRRRPLVRAANTTSNIVGTATRMRTASNAARTGEEGRPRPLARVRRVRRSDRP
jgi:hypothetical protein